jgi:CDP-diglyceride synthetase
VDVRLAPLSLLAGVAVAVGTVAVHQWWWGLLLGAAATLVLELVTPAGWATRLPLALGFDAAVVLLAVPRGEGDYLVASTRSGYGVLGLALLVLCLAIMTLPRPGGKNPRLAGETTTSE